ncbi:MAG TPA: ATP-binding cassette domain-containing protein [Solirubrobacteraceae bacterium]|nr:ATP-binding cassette domain-containing protein [Solirubrobacteraceae bacterium]
MVVAITSPAPISRSPGGRRRGPSPARGAGSAKPLTDPTALHPILLQGQALTIGRDRSNDIVIADRNVSRVHAELTRSGARWTLRDLGSCNGTRLNGRPVKEAVVAPGNEIAVGRFRLTIDDGEVRTESRAGRLEASGVEQWIKGGRCILQPLDLTVFPGELVGVVGEAGAGKSTLIKVLAGVSRPTAGSVSLDGEALALRLVDIGYVPQENTLLSELTVREALTFGAQLRLPPDTSSDEVSAVVAQVLGDLDLQPHAHTRIGGGLSGGQQRRVAVGMELLGSPRVLLLDEPGASLDVIHERQLMALLRRIASRGCAVVCITHSISSLRGFDRLLVMGSGGTLRFDGPPAAALKHFGAASFEAMYEHLVTLPALARRAPSVKSPGRPPLDRPKHSNGDVRRQTRVLASRNARVLSRDRRNLALLLLQAPVLAVGAVLIFGSGAFGVPAPSDRSAQLLFVLVLVCCWVGIVDGARAVVAERPIFLRERSLGVMPEAYLAGKLAVLGGLAFVQALTLATAAFAIDHLHASAGVYVEVTLLLTLTTEASMATGLLLSALVNSENQAGSMLPLLLVPQVLLAGAIVAVGEMGMAGPLSLVAVSRWGLAGAGSALALAESPAASRGFVHAYGSFYSTPWGTGALVLCGLLAATCWLSLLRLRHAWHS